MREQPRRDILPLLKPVQIPLKPVDRLLELPDLAPQVTELGGVAPALLGPNVSEAEIRPGTEKRDPDDLPQHEHDESRKHSAAV